ncbi:hypothetical protein M427DRAFT_211875 [Gonapodya prolifera JEL478]|uniref:DUF4045 domain-containing protein n=1 Tax=Gonapodya prolifera (strain JEL478) TaxID=1344416 RepID=A0A139AP18_GONPJ|nr:hypothetical protein M427DRAFT_211875 [Gonapodya prolifera JEL478]|eukprot:KXS18501.1 hypothetical protein M427DRAFT_211875 [Gonapodya prolifera JEL478]
MRMMTTTTIVMRIARAVVWGWAAWGDEEGVGVLCRRIRMIRTMMAAMAVTVEEGGAGGRDVLRPGRGSDVVMAILSPGHSPRMRPKSNAARDRSADMHPGGSVARTGGGANVVSSSVSSTSSILSNASRASAVSVVSAISGVSGSVVSVASSRDGSKKIQFKEPPPNPRRISLAHAHPPLVFGIGQNHGAPGGGAHGATPGTTPKPQIGSRQTSHSSIGSGGSGGERVASPRVGEGARGATLAHAHGGGALAWAADRDSGRASPFSPKKIVEAGRVGSTGSEAHMVPPGAAPAARVEDRVTSPTYPSVKDVHHQDIPPAPVAATIVVARDVSPEEVSRPVSLVLSDESRSAERLVEDPSRPVSLVLSDGKQPVEHVDDQRANGVDEPAEVDFGVVRVTSMEITGAIAVQSPEALPQELPVVEVPSAVEFPAVFIVPALPERSGNGNVALGEVAVLPDAIADGADGNVPEITRQNAEPHVIEESVGIPLPGVSPTVDVIPEHAAESLMEPAVADVADSVQHPVEEVPQNPEPKPTSYPPSPITVHVEEVRSPVRLIVESPEELEPQEATTKGLSESPEALSAMADSTEGPDLSMYSPVRPRIISEEPESMELEASPDEPQRERPLLQVERAFRSPRVLSPKRTPVYATTEMATVAAVARPAQSEGTLDSSLQKLAGKMGQAHRSGTSSRKLSGLGRENISGRTLAETATSNGDVGDGSDGGLRTRSQTGAEQFEVDDHQSVPPVSESTSLTQAKQALQRMAFLGGGVDPSFHAQPRNQIRLNKELERAELEWGSLRRWDDPMARSLERVSVQVTTLATARAAGTPSSLPEVAVSRTTSTESGSSQGKNLVRTFSTPDSGVPIHVRGNDAAVAGSLGSGGTMWRWFTGRPQLNSSDRRGSSTSDYVSGGGVLETKPTADSKRSRNGGGLWATIGL